MTRTKWDSTKCLLILIQKFVTYIECLYPPASEASREVTNLTEMKNPYTHIHVVKEFFCLSTNSTPNISGLAKQNGLLFNQGFLAEINFLAQKYRRLSDWHKFGALYGHRMS